MSQTPQWAWLRRRRFVLLPIVAAVCLLALRWYTHTQIETTLRHQIGQHLAELLDAKLRALQYWREGQLDDSRLLAEDSEVRMAALHSLKNPGRPPSTQRSGAAFNGLPGQLEERLRELKTPNFLLFDTKFRIVTSDDLNLVGLQPEDDGQATLETVLKQNKAVVSLPFLSKLPLRHHSATPRTGLAVMYAAAPVHDADSKQPIAILARLLCPDADLTTILEGDRNESRRSTSETYAFNRAGYLLTRSRHEGELRTAGLMPTDTELTSVLRVQLREPPERLTKLMSPTDSSLWPLVRPVQLAPRSNDIERMVERDYRDYRGIHALAAWKWLDDWQCGIVTKVSEAEALQTVNDLQWITAVSLSLLAVVVTAMLIVLALNERYRLAADRAQRAVRQLGQYTLEEKLGSGGMGEVYKARHAFLRRPTAIKLLNPNLGHAQGLARFEREVQITSQLSNPNTIAIYDYGHTPDGIFYYAMEYLDGINLEDLVERFGPQPEGRAILLLMQACDALAEAHAAGLVHRDIKPANLILTQRGGLSDFVKVVDFGLVKSSDLRTANLTGSNQWVGTPQYAAPESIRTPEQVDGRADLYALAAVGYFLLTGTPVFRNESATDLAMAHLNDLPDLPSSRVIRPLSEDLETLLMRCLSKNPDGRPVSASELADALGQCQSAGAWTRGHAEAWWRGYRNLPQPTLTAVSGN
jgi:hypothetical protein